MDEKRFVGTFDHQICLYTDILNGICELIHTIHLKQTVENVGRFLPFYNTRRTIVSLYSRIKELRRRLKAIRRFRGLSYRLPFRVIILILSYVDLKVNKKITLLDFYGYFVLDRHRTIFQLWKCTTIFYEARKSSVKILPLSRSELDLYSLSFSLNDEKILEYISKLRDINYLNIPTVKNVATSSLHRFIGTVQKIFISDSNNSEVFRTFEFINRFHNLRVLSIGSYFHHRQEDEGRDEEYSPITNEIDEFNVGKSLLLLELLRFNGGVPKKFRFEDLNALRSIELYSCLDITNRQAFEISLIPKLKSFSWDNAFLYRSSAPCCSEIFHVFLNPNIRRVVIEEVNYEISDEDFISKISNVVSFQSDHLSKIEELDWSGGYIPVSMITQFISKHLTNITRLLIRVKNEEKCTFNEVLCIIGTNLRKIEYLSISLDNLQVANPFGNDDNNYSEPIATSVSAFIRSSDFPHLQHLHIFPRITSGPKICLDHDLKLKKFSTNILFRDHGSVRSETITSLKNMKSIRSILINSGDVTINEFNQLISIKTLRTLKIGNIKSTVENDDTEIKIDDKNTRIRKLIVNKFDGDFFISLVDGLIPRCTSEIPKEEEEEDSNSENKNDKRKIYEYFESLQLQGIPRGVESHLQRLFMKMSLFYPYLSVTISNFFVRKEKYSFFEKENKILNKQKRKKKKTKQTDYYKHEVNKKDLEKENIQYLRKNFTELEKMMMLSLDTSQQQENETNDDEEQQQQQEQQDDEYVEDDYDDERKSGKNMMEQQKSLFHLSKSLRSFSDSLSFQKLPRHIIRKILFEFIFYHPPRRYMSCLFGYFGDDYSTYNENHQQTEEKEEDNNNNNNNCNRSNRFFQVFGNILLQSVNLHRKSASQHPITFCGNGVMNEVHIKNVDVFEDVCTIGRIRKLFCHNTTINFGVEFFDFSTIEYIIFRNCVFSDKRSIPRNSDADADTEEEEEKEKEERKKKKNEIIMNLGFLEFMLRENGSRLVNLRVLEFDQCQLSDSELVHIRDCLGGIIELGKFERLRLFQGKVGSMNIIEEIKEKYNNRDLQIYKKNKNLEKEQEEQEQEEMMIMSKKKKKKNYVLYKKGIKKGQRKIFMNLFRRRRRRKKK